MLAATVVYKCAKITIDLYALSTVLRTSKSSVSTDYCTSYDSLHTSSESESTALLVSSCTPCTINLSSSSADELIEVWSASTGLLTYTVHHGICSRQKLGCCSVFITPKHLNHQQRRYEWYELENAQAVKKFTRRFWIMIWIGECTSSECWVAKRNMKISWSLDLMYCTVETEKFQKEIFFLLSKVKCLNSWFFQ